jgi:hypothetical protein
MPEDAVALMSKLLDFFKYVSHQLDGYFPWCASFDQDERHAFLIDLLQAVHAEDAQQLQMVVDEWQATAEALGNREFMQAWRESDNPDDYVPWEQVRGDSSLSGEVEEGR